MLTSSFRHLDNNCTYSIRALRKKSIDTSSKGEMKGGKRSAEEAKIIERHDEEKKEVEDRKEEGEDEAGASGNCNLTVCCLL